MDKEKINLTEGPKSAQEIADWRGIKKNTYINSKKRYLEELKSFAIYHENGRTIVIDKVLIPVYEKPKSANYQKVAERVPEVWRVGHLETASRVANVIYQEQKEEAIKEGKEKPDCARGTVYQYTLKEKKVLYGVNEGAPGKLGESHYAWGIQIEDEYGNIDYRELTEEEEQIRKEMFRAYFGEESDKIIFIKRAFKDGELTEEECNVLIKEWLNEDDDLAYTEYKRMFKLITGYTLQRCTRVNKVLKFAEDPL